MTKRTPIGPLVVVVALAAALGACSSQKPPAPANAELSAVRTAEFAKLEALAAERTNMSTAETYRVGPGDLLEISVFDIPELNLKERVTTSGYVQLPLIGAVKATGRSEAELASDIAERLEKDYLRNPQVNVFVAEYKSQLVAVTGAVQRPGLYPLPRERRTILDMIAEAGGLTKESGGLIELIPAARGARTAAFDAASVGMPLPRTGSGKGVESAEQGAIVINLNELLRGAGGGSINVPAIAGDVIFVPEVGSFTIEGWVEKPGTYPLTRQTSVLAALSAGGGASFPARLSRVQILRSRGGGETSREIEVVDLDAIRDGRAADVPLRAGDVVRVPGHIVLMPPWAVYAILRDLVRIGANVPMF